MAAERIIARYRLETPYSLERAAELLADGQSGGTFVAVAGDTDELRARFRARVERLTPLETVDTPSLPGSRPPAGSAEPVRYHRGEVVISWSIENMGPNLATLVATVSGNQYEYRQFSGLRLMDLELPESFGKAYPGPQFGIEGTRRLAGVHGRPIIGGIVKPSVGLTPEQTADLVRTLGEAGIDFIKDDELMANPPHSPLARRVEAVCGAINDVADRTGRKPMYAFNITDDAEAMRRHHDTVLKHGGTCVMVSINAVGLVGLEQLRRRCELPIHGHRNGWGMLTRCPQLGMGFTAYQKLWRLAGVDQLHVNGLQNKFWEPDDSVVGSIRACLEPMLGGYQIMPVVASGQWGGQAPETYGRTGSIEVMYLCGGGIMGHPGGPKAGVTAIRQAWEAAVAGTPLEQYAREHAELRQAVETFAKRAGSG